MKRHFNVLYYVVKFQQRTDTIKRQQLHWPTAVAEFTLPTGRYCQLQDEDLFVPLARSLVRTIRCSELSAPTFAQTPKVCFANIYLIMICLFTRQRLDMCQSKRRILSISIRLSVKYSRIFLRLFFVQIHPSYVPCTSDKNTVASDQQPSPRKSLRTAHNSVLEMCALWNISCLNHLLESFLAIVLNHNVRLFLPQ